MSIISLRLHIKQSNVKSNELQSPCSKSLMARYSCLIATLLILEAHMCTDMAMSTRVREVSPTCPMIHKNN